MAAETSREAYREVVADGTETTQEVRILTLLDVTEGPLSARTVGEILGLEARTAGSRIAGLVKKELVKEEGTGPDPTTGKRVKLWTTTSAGRLALAGRRDP